MNHITKNKLPIEVFGLDGIPKFKFIHKDSNYLETILIFGVLKRGSWPQRQFVIKCTY